LTGENGNYKTVNLSCRIDKIIYDQIIEDAAKKELVVIR